MTRGRNCSALSLRLTAWAIWPRPAGGRVTEVALDQGPHAFLRVQVARPHRSRPARPRPTHSRGAQRTHPCPLHPCGHAVSSHRKSAPHPSAITEVVVMGPRRVRTSRSSRGQQGWSSRRLRRLDVDPLSPCEKAPVTVLQNDLYARDAPLGLRSKNTTHLPIHGVESDARRCRAGGGTYGHGCGRSPVLGRREQ